MTESVQIMMLDADYDEGFFGLSYNELGVPFPVYSLDECARIAADRMDISLEEAFEGLQEIAMRRYGSVIFVEEMPASSVGLRVVH